MTTERKVPMFKHFRERLAYLIAPSVRPMTVVERIAPYIAPTYTNTASGGSSSYVWIPGDIKETA